MDFEIKKCTRRCAATDRELAPDEVFYSVLMRDGANLVRRDFAESVWEGPPDDAVGVWKSRMPSASAKRMKLAPNDVMLTLLDELGGESEKECLRYLLALMLIRRRVVQVVDSHDSHDSHDVQQEEVGRNATRITVKAAKQEPMEIVVAEPRDAAHAATLQEQLVDLLYAEEQ